MCSYARVIYYIQTRTFLLSVNKQPESITPSRDFSTPAVAAFRDAQLLTKMEPSCRHCRRQISQRCRRQISRSNLNEIYNEDEF